MNSSSKNAMYLPPVIKSTLPSSEGISFAGSKSARASIFFILASLRQEWNTEVGSSNLMHYHCMHAACPLYTFQLMITDQSYRRTVRDGSNLSAHVRMLLTTNFRSIIGHRGINNCTELAYIVSRVGPDSLTVSSHV